MGENDDCLGRGLIQEWRIYAIILGVCSGSQVLKLVDNRHVKAACKLVVVGIAPFIAKMGITAAPTLIRF